MAHTYEFRQVAVREVADFLQLVTRLESVEEVKERNAAAQRGRVRDRGQVMRLLRPARSEHREPGRAAGHDVAVVAEDRQRVSRHRASRDVHDERRQLARDLVHARDHREEPLGGGERRPERARLYRVVDRAGCPALRVHFDLVGDGSPQVGFPLSCPFIRDLTHRR